MTKEKNANYVAKEMLEKLFYGAMESVNSGKKWDMRSHADVGEYAINVVCRFAVAAVNHLASTATLQAPKDSYSIIAALVISCIRDGSLYNNGKNNEQTQN